MTNEQIVNICCNSGGLLGSSVSNFVGLFDNLKQVGIKASEVVKILDSFPSFALQNRKDMIRRKLRLIEKESGRDMIYIRNFIKRHPDIFIKSMGSLEAKVAYITRSLNRQLKNERAFPLLLHYNYNQVIKPRGDLLKERFNYFELDKAFTPTDEEFCTLWNIEPEELEQAKAERYRKNDMERDYLWSYVHLA